MTKNKFNYIFDKIFWYLVAFIPIVFFIVFAFRNGNITNFGDLLTGFVNSFPSGDLISNVFTDIYKLFTGLDTFVLGGNFPSVLIYLCSYIVYAELFHLLVDFLLFIPNLAHKFMNFLTKD